MSLQDHAVPDDQFELAESVNTEYAFPCMCCYHRDKQDTAKPCINCGHNTRYEPNQTQTHV